MKRSSIASSTVVMAYVVRGSDVDMYAYWFVNTQYKLWYTRYIVVLSNM